MEEEEEKIRQEELAKKEMENEKELEKIINGQKDKEKIRQQEELDKLQLNARPSDSVESVSIQSKSVKERQVLLNRKMTPDFEK